ncbi:ATP-binding protein [Streptomyces sp. NPDC048508]|uniref:ATP-binding protein n=1 Tax=Streptomyces sp. NPDC048508 TaxID=3365561 RepID=UPI00371C691A
MTPTTPPQAPPTGPRSSPVADHQLTVALTGGRHSPRIARHITARWLAAHGAPAPRTPDVVLIVSELVTNAVRHTHGSCALHLTWNGHQLDIAVADQDEQLPDAPGAPGEHGGFGLLLIKGLGGRIKTVAALGGKTVHATVQVAPLSDPRESPPTATAGRSANTAHELRLTAEGT